MHRGFLSAGAVFGFLSVALGAFAAHALKERLSPADIITFETGVRYQFYHALALILTGILLKEFRFPRLLWAGRLFIIGIFLFSFSLFILALCQPNFRWIGMITPFGGAAFLAGWVLMFLAVTGKGKKL